jgi:YHS domain-containing protein
MSVETSHSEPAGEAIDLVCGMTVDRATAKSRGLTSEFADTTWFFCGRGCKLDFDEDPGRYLDPSWSPLM